MTKQYPPAFIAFVERLHQASLQNESNQGSLFKRMLDACVFKNFLDNTAMGAGHRACISYLEKEHELLGLDQNTSLDEIKNTLPVTCSVSDSSMGWAIQAPVNGVFVRFSQSVMRKKERPLLVVGNHTPRQERNDLVVMETHVLMCPLASSEESGKEKMIFNDPNLQNLMNFTVAIVKECGFENATAGKFSDFGLRFFEKEKGDWQNLSFVESKNVVYSGNDGYTTAQQRNVMPVVYMLDTENLKGGMPIQDQYALMGSFLTDDKRLESIGPAEIPLDVKRDMIVCYLNFESANPQTLQPV